MNENSDVRLIPQTKEFEAQEGKNCQAISTKTWKRKNQSNCCIFGTLRELIGPKKGLGIKLTVGF